MFTLLVGLALHAAQATSQKTYDLPATTSVWVYSHAADPVHDAFLRIWGAGNQATSNGGPSDDFSYGYLRWNLKDLPEGEPKSITLIVYGPSLAKEGVDPLEARALKGTIDTDWDYSKANDVVPGADDTVFGTSTPTKADALPQEYKLELSKASFKAYFTSARKARALFLALTSKIDPNSDASNPRAGVYKVYSAAADKYRPTLHIEY